MFPYGIERSEDVITVKRKKHKSILYKYSTLLITGCLLCSAWLGSVMPVWAAPSMEDTIASQKAKAIETNAIPNWPDGPVVTADSAILMDADTGAILYAKNIHAAQYPASTTKILTCLIATEKCAMDERVSFSHEAVFDTPRDSNHIAMDVGYELSMEDALNAILIRSANEVSFAVAEHITGTTWQDFAAIMNARAAELGCVDSNFVNPNGLPDDNHYTSAYDLAMIGRAFFANELLSKISSTKRLHILPGENQPKEVLENNGNELLEGKKYAYEYLVGSKTGFTNAARSCLVSCAEKDGMKLICVVLRDEPPYQYEDTVALFDYGFSNFDKINISQNETKYNIDNSNFFYSNNDIFGNSKPILSLNTKDCIILPKTASFGDVKSSLSYDTQEENEVAVITYTYQEQYIGSVSVDLADGNTATYAFDSEVSGSQGEEGKATKQDNVIFINILKVILWILGIAGAIIVVIVVNALINNYQFSGRDRSSRRSWRRSKRRKRRPPSGHAVRRRRPPASSQAEKKKAKRPSRFRDYDF